MNMTKSTIEFQSIQLKMTKERGKWSTYIRKSETTVTHINQLKLLNQNTDLFVPVTVIENKDVYEFTYSINETYKNWPEVLDLPKHEKLRILVNMGRLETYINSRIVPLLHPENMIFDRNLTPKIVYRGIRSLLPPNKMDEEQYLTYMKCLAVGMFSKKYTFDELVNGSLSKAQDTDIEKRLVSITTLEAYNDYIEQLYKKEQNYVDEQLTFVAKRKYGLYKWLSIGSLLAIVLLVVPLIYLWQIKLPYNESLLRAHKYDIANDSEEVIISLKDLEPEDLPNSAKYLLASAYIKSEKLGSEERTSILKNISLKSDKRYLLYWIHNGKGEFEESIDLAKYLDDPQLIMYGLIKKIEQDKNNPELTGAERDEVVGKSTDELEKLRTRYGVDPEALENDEDAKQEEPEEEKANDKEKEEKKSE